MALFVTCVVATRVADAQMFAHRILIAVPLDDSTRQTGLLPGFSYYADIERGWHSTEDDRAWDARLAGTIELWRITPRLSVVAGMADELVANSLKDGGFNPRGVSWELSMGAAQRIGSFTAQLDFAHYCRHSLDDLNPPFTDGYVPDFVPTERTASMNAPRLRVISPPVRAGHRLELRGALMGERYVMQHDGRHNGQLVGPDSTSNSWGGARSAVGADLRIDGDLGRGNRLFVRASAINVFLGPAGLHPVTPGLHENHRIELGWHASGRAGGLEVYGAVEQLFDDMVDVVPRSSHVIGIGIRAAERNHF